jgi:hypothetical protein
MYAYVSQIIGAEWIEIPILLPRELVYKFIIAAVPNNHKLSGLKQHKFVILQFWRSEI